MAAITRGESKDELSACFGLHSPGARTNQTSARPLNGNTEVIRPQLNQPNLAVDILPVIFKNRVNEFKSLKNWTVCL